MGVISRPCMVALDNVWEVARAIVWSVFLFSPLSAQPNRLARHFKGELVFVLLKLPDFFEPACFANFCTLALD